MAQIIYSDDAFADFERIIEFLLEASPTSASDIVMNIQSGISILTDHPLIGRKRDAFRRELVISYGRSGYIAMYRYDPAYGIVRILRIKHQREVGFAE